MGDGEGRDIKDEGGERREGDRGGMDWRRSSEERNITNMKISQIRSDQEHCHMDIMTSWLEASYQVHI